jgi:hypothetical protein
MYVKKELDALSADPNRQATRDWRSSHTLGHR